MEYTLGYKKLEKPVSVGKPEHIVELLAEYRDLPREVMLVVHIDSNVEAQGIQIAAIGNRVSCCFDMKDIFHVALREDSKTDAIIIAHNHPQEKLVSPTKDDIACTKSIFDVSNAAQIPLLDHVILGKHDWMSFRNKGIVIPKSYFYILELRNPQMRRKGRKSKKFKNMLRKMDKLSRGFVIRSNH